MSSTRPTDASVVIPLAATTTVLTYAAMTTLFPAAMAPEVAPALGVEPSVIGLQISIVYAGAMAASLLGGSMTRRVGACRTSQFALLLLGAGAAVDCAPTVISFAVGSMLIGLGYGLTNPAASHLLMRFAAPQRRRIIFSLKQTGVPLGGVLAGACAPALALALGWQSALLALALLAAAIALCLQRFQLYWDKDRDPSAPLIQSPLADIRLVWSARSLRLLSLAGQCFASIQLCLSAFTVTLLVEDLNVGIVRAGLVMSAIQVCGVIGRVAWGWIGDAIRSGAAALCLATLVTIATTITISFMSPDWPQPLVIAALCAMGFSALGWNGVYLAEVARLAPAGQVARASGGSLFFTFSGVLVGPASFSALHNVVGTYTSAFGILALVAVLGLGLVIVGARRTRTPPG